MNQVFPRLFKHVGGRAPSFWEVSVEPEGPFLLVRYGQEGGKVMETRKKIAGKNIGKKNETTPLQQAYLDAQSLHKSQLDRNLYGYTPEESLEKRLRSPMLAETYEDFADRVTWGDGTFAQPKLDGHRCIARMDDNGQLTLFSRGGEEIKTIKHIEEFLKATMKPGEIFDGEVYAHGYTLNKVSSMVRRYQPGLTEKITYHVYDTFRQEPYYERYARLAERTVLREKGAPVTLVPTFKVSDEQQLFEFQAKCIEKGYEGAMLRHGMFEYEAGSRSKGLLKVKTFQDAEFEIQNVISGTGRFEGMAVFQCVTADGNPFTVTAPGTHEEKREIWRKRELYIGKQLTVKFMNFTNTERPVPYLPVAKNIRFDV